MNAPPDDAGAAAGAADSTAADGSLRKRPRSSNGYPRGVSKTTSGKFQGRTNYKPPGEKRGIQRNVGTFDTAEEAGQAVADAEAKLKAGSEVWTEPSRKNEHKRGEVIAPLLRESRSSRPRTRPSWHADRPLPAAALDAALLDYNIFNCCLLRDLLAAAAQGYGSVLAVLVCVSLGVTLWAVPKSRACTWLWSGKVIVSWLVATRGRTASGVAVGAPTS